MVLTLLIGVSLFIISINYYALDSVLVTAANYYLKFASNTVSAQVGGYFEPLNSKMSIAFHMLDRGVIKPEYSSQFTRFLYSLTADDKNISGAYWADTDGNSCWLIKLNDGNFLERTFQRNGSVHIEKLFDAQGKLLSVVKDLPPDTDDPRLRPWYQQAQLTKHLVWVVYKFLKSSDQEEPVGVTAAFPFYDSKGDLLGVFGMDMLAETISHYIDDIKVTKHSVVFVVDSTANLISVNRLDANLFQGKELPKIVDLKKPWLEKSFAIYLQTHQSPFVYSVNHTKYIASYQKIPGIGSKSPWYVAVVTPMHDIVASLRKGVLFALIFVGMALIAGIILASVFAASLSRPIKKLAQDANSICHLKLVEMKEKFSHIIEIAEVEESFVKMKNALNSFQRYMPIALVKKLIASDKVAVFGGETKELTLIFTDIQDFTQLSESLDPQELMQYLSRYFQVITKVIIEMYGTVDKYMGDSVMAFWGAPTDDSEHALHACEAVLQIQDALKQLNEDWRAENKPMMVTRIGVNTGEMVVGNVGSDDRLNYTALGDHVNLASRLEGLNKIYGTSVIVSEFTYNQVKNKFKFRLLDKVAVKGKTQSVYIYELLGWAVEPNLGLEQYNRDFFAAFYQYEKGRWQTAIDLFNALDKKYPEDRVIKVFVKRCETFIANPPADWYGAWVMLEK